MSMAQGKVRVPRRVLREFPVRGVSQTVGLRHAPAGAAGGIRSLGSTGSAAAMTVGRTSWSRARPTAETRS